MDAPIAPVDPRWNWDSGVALGDGLGRILCLFGPHPEASERHWRHI